MGISFTLVGPEGNLFLGGLGPCLDFAEIINATASAFVLLGDRGQEKGGKAPEDLPLPLLLFRSKKR